VCWCWGISRESSSASGPAPGSPSSQGTR
jgi:hypothetical protein